jgi:DNA-binding transcriptional LysR family regulator
LELSQLNLNQLLALDALLTEKSVSRAARRMYLTQSAMSRALSRLQQTFDDKLLITANGRRMVLTPLAEQLIRPLREALLQIKRITSLKPHFDPAVAHKAISVCASDYVSVTLLPQVLQRTAHDAPNVKVHVIQNDYTWSEKLERGDIDLAIIPERYALANYPKEALFTDSYCCIAWSKNRKVGKSISLEQYLEMKHAAVQFNFIPASEFDEALRPQYGQTRQVGMILPLFSLLPHAIVGTNLLATVQTRLAILSAKFLPIKIMPLPFPMPAIVEVMQYQPYQEADQGTTWFKNLLNEMAKNF